MEKEWAMEERYNFHTIEENGRKFGKTRKLTRLK